jgi:hypothetical protein
MDNLVFLIPVVFAFVIYKANTWNSNPSLFAAQKRERARAASFTDVLTRYFDALDTDKTGLLTQHHLLAVDGLDCNEADKALLRAALCHTGAVVFVAENPWFLAPLAEYEFTPIGHVTGRRKETSVAITGHPYGGVAVPFDVWVDDYAISRADLVTYVDRVNARQTLPSF